MLLKTNRLVLRELREEDAASLARYQSDPRYLEHSEGPPDARAIVDSAMLWTKQSPRLNYQLAVAWSEHTAAIGCIGLRCLGQNAGVAEFGIELDPELWGRGLSREAALALLDFGFAGLNLSRVVASTSPANQGVHAFLTKLGFAPDTAESRVRWSRTRA